MIPNFHRLTSIAYSLLDKSSNGRCQHFSFILNKSKIISIGINDYSRTHPKIKEYKYQPFAKIHSEMSAALRIGLPDCSGLTLVNIRINRENKLSNSMPCFGCQDLISKLAFRSVYYSDSNGNMQKFI